MENTKNPKISIIIPCYNEEKTIGKVLEQIPSVFDEIIVIDNNSTDKSSVIAKNHKSVSIIKEATQGYGAAIKRGIVGSRGDIVAIIDGDNQHYASDMVMLINLLVNKELDFVWGSRFPANKDSVSLLRIIGNIVQGFIFNFLFKINVSDSQSGMMVFRKKRLLESIGDLDKLSDGMAFSEEIKLRAILAGLKYDEKKINVKKRIGASKLNPFSDGIKNIVRIFKLFYEFKIRKNH